MNRLIDNASLIAISSRGTSMSISTSESVSSKSSVDSRINQYGILQGVSLSFKRDCSNFIESIKETLLKDIQVKYYVCSLLYQANPRTTNGRLLTHLKKCVALTSDLSPQRLTAIYLKLETLSQKTRDGKKLNEIISESEIKSLKIPANPNLPKKKQEKTYHNDPSLGQHTNLSISQILEINRKGGFDDPTIRDQASTGISFVNHRITPGRFGTHLICLLRDRKSVV